MKKISGIDMYVAACIDTSIDNATIAGQKDLARMSADCSHLAMLSVNNILSDVVKESLWTK